MKVSDIIRKEIKDKGVSMIRASTDMGMSDSWMSTLLAGGNITCNNLGKILNYLNLNLIAEDDLGVKTIFPNINTGRSVINYIDSERAHQSMIRSDLAVRCNRVKSWATPALSRKDMTTETMLIFGRALNIKFLINDTVITPIQKQ